MKTFSLFDPAIRSGSYWAQVEACYSRTWASYVMAPHLHERIEIMYVLKGNCCVHMLEHDHGNAPQRSLKLGPGEFVLLDQCIPHALEVPDDCYMANTEFSIAQHTATPLTIAGLTAASKAFSTMVSRDAAFVQGIDIGGEVYACLSNVVGCYITWLHTPESRALLDTALAHLLLLVAQKVQHGNHKGHTLFYVKRAQLLLHERLQEDIRIDGIAKEVGIHSAYLQRIFKQSIGMSIIEYVNKQRIERAKFLLASTSEKITDIAFDVGFNSRQHFNQVFSKTTGMSPRTFRIKHTTAESRQVYLFDSVAATILELPSPPQIMSE